MFGEGGAAACAAAEVGLWGRVVAAETAAAASIAEAPSAAEELGCVMDAPAAPASSPTVVARFEKVMVASSELGGRLSVSSSSSVSPPPPPLRRCFFLPDGSAASSASRRLRCSSPSSSSIDTDAPAGSSVALRCRVAPPDASSAAEASSSSSSSSDFLLLFLVFGLPPKVFRRRAASARRTWRSAAARIAPRRSADSTLQRTAQLAGMPLVPTTRTEVIFTSVSPKFHR